MSEWFVQQWLAQPLVGVFTSWLLA
jgi:hypothetical protein